MSAREVCGATTANLVRNGYPCEATCTLAVEHHGPHTNRTANGRVYASWYDADYHHPQPPSE